MKQRLWAVLPHLCVICALAALTLCVVDNINTQMGFLTSAPGRSILLGANVLALLLGVRCILHKE